MSDTPATTGRANVTVSKQGTALLLIHARTALHPGSGTALGAVDLPVQRERHTQWPTIAGSALKGILRDACREKAKEDYQDEFEEKEENGQRKAKLKRSRRQVANEEDAMLVAAFGPGKVDESSSHAGALSVTDARILAFPVRSLRGVFAWVTCMEVLQRLERDLTLAHMGGLTLPEAPEKDKALCQTDGPLLVDDNKLVLEEFEFEHTGDAGDMRKWISDWAPDDLTRQRLLTHLVVLHNDDFTHFVRHATEVVARIGLDYERKTVRSGALFYQEFLPAETILYSLVLATASRRENHARSAAEMLAYLRTRVEEAKVLQIGGDETTGKGLCAVRLVDGKEGGS